MVNNLALHCCQWSKLAFIESSIDLLLNMDQSFDQFHNQNTDQCLTKVIIGYHKNVENWHNVTPYSLHSYGFSKHIWNTLTNLTNLYQTLITNKYWHHPLTDVLVLREGAKHPLLYHDWFCDGLILRLVYDFDSILLTCIAWDAFSHCAWEASGGGREREGEK